MKYKTALTPNFSKGRIIQPKGIVLHHSAGNFEGSVSWILDKVSKVSYHAIVDTTGDVIVFGNDTRRMWHSGESSFKGRKDCNSFMLGISVTGDTNKRELTQMEIKSVANWCYSKMQLYGFGLDWITTHREISPGRKSDVDVRAEKKIKEEIKRLINL